MIIESTTIEIKCDTKGCISYDRVQAEDRNECNRQLFMLGWRMHNGKQICDICAGQLRRKRAKGDAKTALWPRG